ncbi:MAG: 7-cyano-7-deazaguanine synthase [Planctomycetes bacterium]|nr:7-cyano-7-deazaguanine synthase [Planctomycetota bacterium]
MKSSARASETTPITTAILLSGGLDSAILLGHLLQQGARVQPIYITTGCIWQAAEQRAIEQFLAAIGSSAIAPLVELAVPLADLYGEHWSFTGQDVPDQTTPDEAVFLWGRNPLLLMKAMLWCSMHDISRLALATLRCNPFADATPQFFQQFQQALATATESRVEILRPFAAQNKQQVLALGADLPLHLTFSCLSPQEDQHCGICNKCAERARGLQTIPSGDPTNYAFSSQLIANS